VTKTAHQVFGCRTGRGSQRLAGVAHVMKAEARHGGRTPSSRECLPDGIGAHRAAAAPDEYTVGTCPGGHVLSEERQDVRRNADGAAARVGLGSASKAWGVSSSTRVVALPIAQRPV